MDVKQQQLTLATHRHAPPLAASIILTLKYRSVSVRDGQTTRRQVLRRIRTDIVCFSLTVDAASEAIKGEVRVCVCGVCMCVCVCVRGCVCVCVCVCADWTLSVTAIEKREVLASVASLHTHTQSRTVGLNIVSRSLGCFPLNTAQKSWAETA